LGVHAGFAVHVRISKVWLYLSAIHQRPLCSLADEVTYKRASVLAVAFEKHPNRFKNKIPVPDMLPEAVWINPPSTENSGA
jgi:hypothetical protein